MESVFGKPSRLSRQRETAGPLQEAECPEGRDSVLYKKALPPRFHLPMEIAITILSILHVFVALLLILIVMWQKPRQEGLGTSFGGGMSEQMFGAQATNVLQKGTVWLSIFFFANTIVIAVLMAQQTKSKRASGLLTDLPAATAPAIPAAPAPAATSPGAPTETPAPAPETPAPAPETPAPAPETPTPAPETPAPAPETPTPAPETPTPAPETPAPAPETPAPAPAGQQP